MSACVLTWCFKAHPIFSLFSHYCLNIVFSSTVYGIHSFLNCFPKMHNIHPFYIENITQNALGFFYHLRLNRNQLYMASSVSSEGVFILWPKTNWFGVKLPMFYRAFLAQTTYAKAISASHNIQHPLNVY